MRWLVVESSVGLSHQVGAVVEQVFAVDPLAVAHAIALVGDEVLGFAVLSLAQLLKKELAGGSAAQRIR